MFPRGHTAAGGLHLPWQVRVFACVYIGYASYLFMRKSFSCVVPSLLQDPVFASLTKEQVGGVSTAMGFTYAVGKILLGGILADRLSPRIALFVGLTICALLHVGIAASASLSAIAILWAVNGLFQGGGWGPCAKLLLSWFPKRTRGTWWGMAATSQSAGAGLCALVCAYFSQEYGWRVGMMVPAAIGITAAVIILVMVKTSPREVGLPLVDLDSTDARKDEGEGSLSASEAFKLSVLQPDLMGLGIAICLVYIIRQGLSDWVVLYLVEGKEMSIVAAGNCVAWFEIGGFAGASASGVVSDRFFGGRRSIPNVIFMLGELVTVPLVTVFDDAISCSLVLFAVGFFIYGPQMLIGVHVVEAADKRVCATAQGVAGVWAGLGSMVAGYPIGRAIASGWGNFFTALSVCAVLIMFFLGLLVRTEYRQHKSTKEK